MGLDNEKGGHTMSAKLNLFLDTAFNVVDRALRGEIGHFLCGEYLDGTTRSIPDALSGEMKSPKQRKKEERQKKESIYKEVKDSKKQKPKKKKKKKKQKKIKVTL